MIRIKHAFTENILKEMEEDSEEEKQS